MDLNKISKDLLVDQELLSDLHKSGLLEYDQSCDKVDSCFGCNIDKLSLYCFLTEIGLDIPTLVKYSECEKKGMKKEQISILKKGRFLILDDIHKKQQLLDRLDYLLLKMRKEV